LESRSIIPTIFSDVDGGIIVLLLDIEKQIMEPLRVDVEPR
jgi:hypothetical protein